MLFGIYHEFIKGHVLQFSEYGQFGIKLCHQELFFGFQCTLETGKSCIFVLNIAFQMPSCEFMEIWTALQKFLVKKGLSLLNLLRSVWIQENYLFFVTKCNCLRILWKLIEFWKLNLIVA